MPTVCICHTEMTGSAQAIARISGCPDYPFLTVGYPHIPTAIWTDEECAEIARAIAPDVVKLLTQP